MDIEITHSKNRSLIGLKGRVINETKNTLLISTKSSNKTIIKSQVKIMIKNQNMEIEGKSLVRRSEERIK